MLSEFDRMWAERQLRVERARGPFDELCPAGMLHVDTSVGRDGPLRVYRLLDQELLAAREWCYQNRRPRLLAEEATLATWVVLDRLIGEVVYQAAHAGLDPATTVWALTRMRCVGPAAAERVRASWSAVREWREANQQKQRYQDEVCLAIRWTAAVAAGDLVANTDDDQDPGAVAWIVAGLRCPRRPFCLGCDACFTIDAPHRTHVTFAGQTRQ